MKIQLLSDLHTEFWARAGLNQKEHLQTFITEADVLVLAGDIAAGRRNTVEVLEFFSKHYPHVIYVMGNHEEYGSRYGAYKEAKEFADKLPANVHFLNPGSVRIDDTTFIGAPLWTNFGNDPLAEHAAGYGISDFRRVGGLKPYMYAQEYEKQISFIRGAYVANKGKKVIVTHFLPAMECTDPKYRNEGILNKYFANNLGGYISNLSDTTWMFGHTHDSVDMSIGDTRLLCNPYGYAKSALNPNFNAHYVYEN